MDNHVTLIIADDHPLFRSGLRSVIELDERYRIIEETGDGDRALQLIEKRTPAIAVLDIDMPGKNGLQLAALVRERQLPTAVVILTMYAEQDILTRALDLGVMGYVLKDSAATEIIDCLSSVSCGEPYVSPSLTKFLLKRKRTIEEKQNTLPGFGMLTGTELKVLKLVAEGKSTKEIAAGLSVSHKTVETHRSNICTKLGVHGTNALVRFALENKALLG